MYPPSETGGRGMRIVSYTLLIEEVGSAISIVKEGIVSTEAPGVSFQVP